MTAPAGKLAWLIGLRGPEAQIWHGDYAGNEHTKARVLATHPLTPNEVTAPIAALARKYPAPKVSND